MPEQSQSQNPLELSLGQKFEMERFSRAIEESTSIDDLRKIGKVLLNGWFTQRAATQWLMKQALSAPVSPAVIDQQTTEPQ